MPFYIMETEMFKNFYSSPEMKRIFEEKNYIEAMIKFEVTLAEVQAELGMIPKEAAAEIKAKGSTEYVSVEKVAEINNKIKLFTVALVREFKSVCEGNAGEYIHYGATSQDLIETALAYRVKEALNIIENKLKNVLKLLLNLAKEHRETLMTARTHGQQALPATFGLMMASYASMIHNHLERIKEARKRILVGSLVGAVGTSASFYAIGGDKILPMQKMVMDRMGLGTPLVDIQPDNNRWAELLNLLGLIAQTFEKMGEDLYTLQRTEIAEVAEPFDTENQICSSTMPQKRNPIYAEMMPPFAKKVISNASAMMSSHHRDFRHYTPFYMYDLLIPESFLLVDTMLNAGMIIFGGILVNKDKMKETLDLTGGLLTSEALLFELSKKTGKKETGMAIVHRLAMYAFENNIPFVDVCMEDKEISEYFSKEEVKKILAPENYIGISREVVDEVVETYGKGV